jgi:hypothetical protein
MAYTVPKAPDGLGVAGRRLWIRVVTDSEMEFAPQEVVLLEEAAYTADVIAGLRKKIDPEDPDPRTVREVRMAGEQLRKFLTSVPWPADESSWEGLSVSERGRRAAFARWHR